MFIIYVIDSSTKNKMYKQGFIFLQKSKIQTVGNRRKVFQLFHFRNCILDIAFAENAFFSENAQFFVGAFL